MSKDNFDSVFFTKATKNKVKLTPLSVSEQMQEELEPILLDKDFGGPLPHDKPAVEIQKQKGRIKKFIEDFVNKR